jgi:hypothetical protein
LTSEFNISSESISVIQQVSDGVSVFSSLGIVKCICYVTDACLFSS